MPTPRTIAARAPCESFSPKTSTWPTSGATSPAAIEESVLLPAPFSPTIAWILRASSASEASRTATVAPYRFVTDTTRSATSIVRASR